MVCHPQQRDSPRTAVFREAQSWSECSGKRVLTHGVTVRTLTT